MICPLCKREETSDYVLKLQRRIGKDKINISEVDIGKQCGDDLKAAVGVDGVFQAPYCYWNEEVDGIYETDCENRFIIIDGDPPDNNMKYCPYCGKIIRIFKPMEHKSPFCTFDE